MELTAESTISVTVRIDSITTSIDKSSIHLLIEGFAVDYSMNIFPVVLDKSYEADEIAQCHEASKKYRVGTSHYVTGTFSLYSSPTKIYIYPSSISLLAVNSEKKEILKEHEECLFAYETWLVPINVSGRIISVGHRQPDSSAQLMFVDLAVEDKIIELVLFPREIRQCRRLIKIDNFIDVYGRTDGEGAEKTPLDPELLNGKIIVDRVKRRHHRKPVF